MRTVVSVHSMSPWSGFNFFYLLTLICQGEVPLFSLGNLIVFCLNVCFFLQTWGFLLYSYDFSIYLTISYSMCSCINLLKGSQSLDTMDMFISYVVFVDILMQCSENHIHHTWYSVFSLVSCAGINFHCIFIGSFVLSFITILPVLPFPNNLNFPLGFMYLGNESLTYIAPLLVPQPLYSFTALHLVSMPIWIHLFVSIYI